MVALAFRHTGDETALLLAGLSSGVGTKCNFVPVSRNTEDKTALLSAGLSSSVGTKYEQVGFGQDKSSFAVERCRGQ